MQGWRCFRKKRFQFASTSLKRLAAKIAIFATKQIEEHKRRWSLFRQKIHPRCGGMEAQLQRIKIEFIILNNDNLSVENAAYRQGGAKRLQQFGKVSI